MNINRLQEIAKQIRWSYMQSKIPFNPSNVTVIISEQFFMNVYRWAINQNAVPMDNRDVIDCYGIKVSWSPMLDGEDFITGVKGLPDFRVHTPSASMKTS